MSFMFLSFIIAKKPKATETHFYERFLDNDLHYQR